MKKYLTLIILILLAVSGVFVFTYKRTLLGTPPAISGATNSTDASAPPAALSTTDYSPPLPAPSDPQGFNRYQNAAYRFSLLYPNDLGVREYKESTDSMSATFESADGGKGFQIYMTKYSGAQITPEQFKLDQPSGVREEPTDVIVDGTRATMFYGRNSAMGDTREVWFIHGGYLYEVTTYKELDSWLGTIMQTWKFN